MKKGMNERYSGKIGMQHKQNVVYMKDVYLDTESRTISGYAAVFNNVDKAGDMLISGCFSKSIRERGPESNANDKILLLWQHEVDEPIGRIVKLIEDDKGLYFEAEIDRIELGDRAISQLESGTLNQFSIGFSYVWENCEWDNDIFIVKEVKLYEISVVTFGCNPETEYLGLKSSDDCPTRYKKLNDKISLLSRKMGARNQQLLQEIISEAVSLSLLKPDLDPLDSKKADKHDNSIFFNLKLKEQ